MAKTVTTENIKTKVGMSNAEMDKVTKKTGNVLKGQEKVEIRLPKSPFKGDNTRNVCVNGYIYQIERGVKVKVPKTVAEILEQAGEI